jgi:hypothetical protein
VQGASSLIHLPSAFSLQPSSASHRKEAEMLKIKGLRKIIGKRFGGIKENNYLCSGF